MVQRPQRGDMLRASTNTFSFLYEAVEQGSAVRPVPDNSYIIEPNSYVIFLAIAAPRRVGFSTKSVILYEILTSSGRRGFVLEADLQVV